MLISELINALGKINQIAGDIPVVLKHVEQEAETELVSLGLHIDPTSGSTGGKITLEHGAAPVAPVQTPEAPVTPPAA